MEMLDEPIVLPFSTFLNISTKGLHPRMEFIQTLIAQYGCFQDKVEPSGGRWASKKNRVNHTTPSQKTERPRIGVQDFSKSSMIKKDLQSYLNKLTQANYPVLMTKILALFDMTYLSIFIDVIWNYLQRQPEFQTLYIQMIETIYEKLTEDAYIEIGIVWNGIWRKYVSSKEWKLSRELVEQSHNYNDFCDYMKEKTRLISTIQAWARLINLGIVSADPFELMYEIMFHMVRELDKSSKIDGMCLECYVEQLREYYKSLTQDIQKRMPKNMDSLIQDLSECSVHKSCEFKIQELIALFQKNEMPRVKKNISIYDLEHDEF